MMPRLAALLLLVVAQIFVSGSSLFAAADLEPTPSQLRTTLIINRLVQAHHYRKVSLDDSLSALILNRYFLTLDPNHNYFLSEDIAHFDYLQHRLDDAIRRARLEPAFEIYKIFAQRVEERVNYAQSLLGYPFDFTIDESIDLNRNKADWAKSTDEINQVWRKRVKNDFLNEKIKGLNNKEIQQQLFKRYQRLITRIGQLNATDVFQFFINAYVTTVEPHTTYFSPRAEENFRIRMSLSLQGIGAVLQTENEYTLIRRVVAGGPAARSGKLQAGDRITGVGQGGGEGEAVVNVVGWRLDDVVDLIRGEKGTLVRLEIIPKEAKISTRQLLTLTRDQIKLEDQAAKKTTINIEEDPTIKIGVVSLPTFYIDFEAKNRGDENYRSSTRDIRKLLKELEDESIDALVVDLRDNGGGSLDEALGVTGLFIDSGPVVQVRDSRGRVRIKNDPDPGITYNGPLVVLVDRDSASASEIFAGAIQDYGRGLILGETSFGKGTVQNLVSLDRVISKSDAKLGQLKMTIAQFFRVNGHSTQFSGVVPDITLYPENLSTDNNGERALERALPSATIDKARFEPHHGIDLPDLLPELIEASKERTIDDADFISLRDQRSEEALNPNQAVSLVEATRRAETSQQGNNEEEENKAGAKQPNDALIREAARILVDMIHFSRSSVAVELPSDNSVL